MQLETTSTKQADPIVSDFWAALMTQRAELDDTKRMVLHAQVLNEAVRQSRLNPFAD